MDSQLKKGLLEGCVLAAIRDEESYGYKIIGQLSPFIEISESTLYPILKRLEASKLVNSITEKGKVRLREFCRDMDQIMEIYRFLRRG